MRELEHLLPELDPPHGGLARLRQRIETNATRGHRSHRALRWSTALALPALVLAVLLAGPFQQWQHTRELTRALRAAMQPAPPAQGLAVHDGTALALPSGQANVRLYLVQSDTAPETTDKTH